jgi:hypothetical protein
MSSVTLTPHFGEKVILKGTPDEILQQVKGAILQLQATAPAGEQIYLSVLCLPYLTVKTSE